jgi:hypothetical protein
VWVAMRHLTKGMRMEKSEGGIREMNGGRAKWWAFQLSATAHQGERDDCNLTI